MKELFIIAAALLVLWYLTEPQLVAVVDRIPGASVDIDLAGASVRVSGSESGYVWAPDDPRSVEGWLYVGPSMILSLGGF
jgi:hypothetical protein